MGETQLIGTGIKLGKPRVGSITLGLSTKAAPDGSVERCARQGTSLTEQRVLRAEVGAQPRKTRRRSPSCGSAEKNKTPVTW